VAVQTEEEDLRIDREGRCERAHFLQFI